MSLLKLSKKSQILNSFPAGKLAGSTFYISGPVSDLKMTSLASQTWPTERRCLAITSIPQTIGQKPTDLPTCGPKQVTHFKKAVACRLSALSGDLGRLTTSHFDPNLPDPGLRPGTLSQGLVS